MTPDAWWGLAKWVGAMGGIGAFGALIKWVVDQASGRADRKTAHVRSAIEAIQDAAEWAEAYWQYRQECRRRHGYDAEMPPAPDERTD